VMHGRERSDPAIVARKPTNKAERSAAEPVERRAGAEGNAGRHHTHRAQDRASVSQALDRVRQTCRQIPKVGAVCGNSARTVLCGGRPVMGVPTAIPAVFNRSIPPLLNWDPASMRTRRPPQNQSRAHRFGDCEGHRHPTADPARPTGTTAYHYRPGTYRIS
jgi:hypothetical protein